MMARRMTIERLAEMTQTEFVAIHEKIDNLGSSLRGEMREGFRIVDERFDQLLNRMDAGFASARLSWDEKGAKKEDIFDLEERVSMIEKRLKIRK